MHLRKDFKKYYAKHPAYVILLVMLIAGLAIGAITSMVYFYPPITGHYSPPGNNTGSPNSTGGSVTLVNNGDWYAQPFYVNMTGFTIYLNITNITGVAHGNGFEIYLLDQPQFTQLQNNQSFTSDYNLYKDNASNVSALDHNNSLGPGLFYFVFLKEFTTASYPASTISFNYYLTVKPF